MTLKQKILGYWCGLKLKPSRMQGNSGKFTWVVASSHPCYSIKWTWAIYWDSPMRPNTTWRWFFYYDYKYSKSISFLGFSMSTQDVMYDKK